VLIQLEKSASARQSPRVGFKDLAARPVTPFPDMADRFCAGSCPSQKPRRTSWLARHVQRAHAANPDPLAVARLSAAKL